MKTVQILPVTGKDAVFINIKEKTFYIENIEFLRFTTYIINESDGSETVATDIFPITSTDIKDTFCCNDEEYLIDILDRKMVKTYVDDLITRGFEKIS